jgi:tectonic-1/3
MGFGRFSQPNSGKFMSYFITFFFVVVVASPRRTAKAVGFGITSNMCPSHRFTFEGGQRLSLTSTMWTAVPYARVAPAQYAGVPDGCTCVNDIQAAADCTVFRCVQGCNLVRGQCDTFCCSDPDCTADQILAFRAAGRCLPEPTPYQVRRCQDLSTLDRVNVKFRMELSKEEDDGEGALSTVLCVAIDNNPVKGNFYETPLELIGTSALLDKPTINNKPSFGMSAPVATRRLIARPVTYQAGVQLPAAIGTPAPNANDPDVLAIAGGGFLQVPIAGPDGSCLETNYAEFGIGVDQATNVCARDTTEYNGESMGELCEIGSLSKIFHLENLYIGKTPRASITMSSDFVQPTIRNVYMRRSNSTSDVAVAITSSVVTTPTSFDTATGVCSNAVAGTNLVITHNSRGSITSAQVDLYISDMDLNGDPVLLSHGLEYNGWGGNNNTLIVRKVSGNPGYIRGLSLQSGSLIQEAAGTDVERRAIEYNYAGFTVNGPAGSGGACFSTSSTFATPWWDVALGRAGTETQNYRQIGVDFGVNVQSSCTVELTYDEFTNSASSWCTDLSQMGLFDLADNRVGVYGNADPLKEWEWLPIEIDTSGLVQTSFSSSANELTCLNLVSEQRVQVLWTKSGEVNNPQPMVLAVRVQYAQRDWTWAKGLHSMTGKQRFVFSHVITFVEYTERNTNLYKPEVPPLLPAIPSDVFYPFDIATSGASRVGDAGVTGRRALGDVVDCVTAVSVVTLFGTLILGVL